MKALCYLLLSIGITVVARAQTAKAVPASASADNTPAVVTGDRFYAIRQVADRFKEKFEALEAESMAEVDKHLSSPRCQSTRVNGLIDRVESSLDEWSRAELKYWQSWGDAEQDRVDEQRKVVDSLEADAKRASDLIDTEKADREDLLRRKATLEKSPRRSEEVTRSIDDLVLSIRDKEAKLTEAQQKFQDIQSKITNMNASLATRLVQIRQNKTEVEAGTLQLKARYEDKRKSAQEICDTKRPETFKRRSK